MSVVVGVGSGERDGGAGDVKAGEKASWGESDV